jgi:calcineurin-like phosphoesterase family protein
LIWFTSDFHFAHSAIIKHSDRPFRDVEEMNAEILTRVNSVVRSEDSLWFLGDFCTWFGNDQAYWDRVKFFRDQIVCERIFLVYGNHDKKMRSNFRRTTEIFYRVHDLQEILIDNQPITLCLYPLLSWDKSFHGSYHLFGHEHGNIPDNPSVLSMDVGVDTNNFYPYSSDDIFALMSRKTWKKGKRSES